MTRDLLELRLKQARKTFEGGGLYAIRYSEVADDCEELLRDWPEYPGLRRFAGEACYRAARYWLKQRELDRALGYAQRAVVLDPSARHYFARLGRVLDRRGDYEAAAEAYTTEIKRGSADANLFYHRGTALTALRRYTEALSDFDRVVELAPNHLPDDLRRCRALCQVALKRVDDALAELTETLRVSPEDDAALRMRGSIRARERGLIGPGLEDLNEAVRLGRIKGFEDGNDLSASLLDRAKILRHAGRVDEAVRDLREIGDDPGPFGTLGREILGQILKERE
jgi:tetratricopeptide (TPR) repeat protein